MSAASVGIGALFQFLNAFLLHGVLLVLAGSAFLNFCLSLIDSGGFFFLYYLAEVIGQLGPCLCGLLGGQFLALCRHLVRPGFTHVFAYHTKAISQLIEPIFKTTANTRQALLPDREQLFLKLANMPVGSCGRTWS